MSKDETGYNGWANYETWNVALWIGNDEGLYRMARQCRTYSDFVEEIQIAVGDAAIGFQTPDGVAWNDSGLNIDELNAMMKELND